LGKNSDFFRLLKKLQMQGVEERGMRRTFRYVAVTRDEDNEAGGLFEAPLGKPRGASKPKEESIFYSLA
jgi:hypothetical protein